MKEAITEANKEWINKKTKWNERKERIDRINERNGKRKWRRRKANKGEKNPEING